MNTAPGPVEQDTFLTYKQAVLFSFIFMVRETPPLKEQAATLESSCSPCWGHSAQPHLETPNALPSRHPSSLRACLNETMIMERVFGL